MDPFLVKGTLTVPNGSTTATFAHGLPITPSIQDVTVTPTADPGATYSVAVDATNVTVTLSGAAGANGAPFAVKVDAR